MSMADKAKHEGEEMKGKVKEGVGDAVGNESLQREGKSDQASGNTKQAGDKVKDAAGDVKDAFKS